STAWSAPHRTDAPADPDRCGRLMMRIVTVATVDSHLDPSLLVCSTLHPLGNHPQRRSLEYSISTSTTILSCKYSNHRPTTKSRSGSTHNDAFQPRESCFSSTIIIERPL